MNGNSGLSRRGLLPLAMSALLAPAIGRAQGRPRIEVYKTPTCGCCGAWADHMERAGFPVSRHDLEVLDPIKTRAGVPAELESCHTAFVAGYALEGHVPLAAIEKLLAERPAGRGLAVPGMPIGSPGMESGNRREPYTVWFFADRRRPQSFFRVD